MQTGVISFCDRIAYNIKSTNTKEDILRDIETRYGLKIIQKQWHRLDQEGSIHITRSPHWMCLRSNGNPYFMLFTRYEDVQQIFFIDKKIQPNYHVPRIILGRGRFDDSLFNNTVLDGEMVKDSRGQWVFLINDMLAHNNRSLVTVPLPSRIKMVYEMLEKNYVPDPVCDICVFQVKQFFPCSSDGLNSMEQMVTTLPYTNRGVYFWPHNMKYKPKLHNFDDSLIKSVVRKVKDVPDFQEAGATQPTQPSAPQNTPPSPTRSTVSHSTHSTSTFVDTSKMKTLYLKKTGESDVYDVYETSGATKCIGIAGVPNMGVSRMMRSAFKDATIAVTKPFMCEFNTKFNKWVPVQYVQNVQ
jgi:hypothetical protein